MACMAGRISFLLITLLLSLRDTFGAVPSGSQLHVNALVGMNAASVFQCWAVDPPLFVSKQPGTIGTRMQSIGDMSGGTIVFFNTTAPTDAGLHFAPAPQWVVIVQGSGLVTLPGTNATLSLPLGSIIIANDTAEVSKLGHDSKWSAGTITLQLPFMKGVAPNHTVVNQNGPCKLGGS